MESTLVRWIPSEPPIARAAFAPSERFAFGGVAFELLGDHGRGPLTLPPNVGQFVSRQAMGGMVAHVVCSIREDASLAEHATGVHQVRWSWTGDYGRVETGRSKAEVARLQRGRYAVTARVAPGSVGLSALVRSLAAAIARREGGLVLHASAAALDGKALLFVGPSGAGKSTACRMLRGASLIAGDRVILQRTEVGAIAWGVLDGNDPATELPRGPVSLPVGAILRVRHGVGSPSVVTAKGAGAIAILRESLMVSAGSTEDERALLDDCEALAAAVPVLTVQTVLGTELTPHVRPWGGGGHA